LRNAASAALRPRPVDAVDRGCVIAARHQQALDAGAARLLVVILAVLGEIGDEQAVLALRRPDLGEGGARLAGAAAACGGDGEIVLRRDAELVGPALRRRHAIERQRARMQEHTPRRQIALQHHAALRRIEPEPAARRGRAIGVDAERGVHHIAHAIAQLQIGARGRHARDDLGREHQRGDGEAAPGQHK